MSNTVIHRPIKNVAYGQGKVKELSDCVWFNLLEGFKLWKLTFLGFVGVLELVFENIDFLLKSPDPVL